MGNILMFDCNFANNYSWVNQEDHPQSLSKIIYFLVHDKGSMMM